jgi:hypothetical protein
MKIALSPEVASAVARVQSVLVCDYQSMAVEHAQISSPGSEIHPVMLLILAATARHKIDPSNESTCQVDLPAFLSHNPQTFAAEFESTFHHRSRSDCHYDDADPSFSAGDIACNQ